MSEEVKRMIVSKVINTVIALASSIAAVIFGGNMQGKHDRNYNSYCIFCDYVYNHVYTEFQSYQFLKNSV